MNQKTLIGWKLLVLKKNNFLKKDSEYSLITKRVTIIASEDFNNLHYNFNIILLIILNNKIILFLFHFLIF